MLDLNEIINAAMDGPSTSRRAGDQSCTETYMSEVSGKNMQPSSETDQLKCQDDKPNMDPPGIKAIQVDQGSSERDSKSQDVSNAVATKTNDQNAVAPQVEKVAEPADQHISPISHVAVAETPSAASALHDADGECGPPDLGGTPRRDSDVWTEVQRKLLRGDVAGSRMGPVHDQSLPEQRQGGTQEVHEVRRAQDRGPGTKSDGGPSPDSGRGPRPSSGKAKAAAKTFAAPSVISSQGESDWAIPSEPYETETMNHQPMPASEEWHAMQSRMLNLENALTRVIRHLEVQAIQEQIEGEDLDQ